MWSCTAHEVSLRAAVLQEAQHVLYINERSFPLYSANKLKPCAKAYKLLCDARHADEKGFVLVKFCFTTDLEGPCVDITQRYLITQYCVIGQMQQTHMYQKVSLGSTAHLTATQELRLNLTYCYHKLGS